MHGPPTYGKAFKATLRILFSAGNLLYVLAGSILLLLAMLPLLGAVYNLNPPPLRSGGARGGGGQCRLRDEISIFQSFAALTPTPLPQGEGLVR